MSRKSFMISFCGHKLDTNLCVASLKCIKFKFNKIIIKLTAKGRRGGQSSLIYLSMEIIKSSKSKSKSCAQREANYDIKCFNMSPSSTCSLCQLNDEINSSTSKSSSSTWLLLAGRAKKHCRLVYQLAFAGWSTWREHLRCCIVAGCSSCCCVVLWLSWAQNWLSVDSRLRAARRDDYEDDDFRMASQSAQWIRCFVCAPNSRLWSRQQQFVACQQQQKHFW